MTSISSLKCLCGSRFSARQIVSTLLAVFMSLGSPWQFLRLGGLLLGDRLHKSGGSRLWKSPPAGPHGGAKHGSWLGTIGGGRAHRVLGVGTFPSSRITTSCNVHFRFGFDHGPGFDFEAEFVERVAGIVLQVGFARRSSVLRFYNNERRSPKISIQLVDDRNLSIFTMGGHHNSPFL